MFELSGEPAIGASSRRWSGLLGSVKKELSTGDGGGSRSWVGPVLLVGGFEAFSQIGNSNTTYYCCTDGTDFEIGIGTYTASGTTLARTTILQSSNSDSAVNWTSGTRTIFCTLPAEKMVFKDASDVVQGFTEQDPNALAFAIALG